MTVRAAISPRWLKRGSGLGASRRYAGAAVAVLLLDGCQAPADTPVAPVPPVPASAPGVAAALTLDLSVLPNYAAPSFPRHYSPSVRALTNAPAGNPVTDRGALLGRVLFHDTQLSVNRTVSCASCHQQAMAFSDSAQFSLGFGGVDRTQAHSMRLANARFYGSGQAFWDQRSPTFEDQAIRPIQDPVEMGFDAAHGGMAALVARLQERLYYRELFAFAFGDSTITESGMQRALAQYVRSIVSTDSRFDQGWSAVYDPARSDSGRSLPYPTLSPQENRGKDLFLTRINAGGAGCNECHEAPTFAFSPLSGGNGLDAGEARFFKSPALRNLGVRSRFMHDGRFTTLEQVVEHYDSGVQVGPALDSRLRTIPGQAIRLNLSAPDKAALVAFLRTLDDEALMLDPKFSDPFRR